jgi:galactose mutarotase-like enzyme
MTSMAPLPFGWEARQAELLRLEDPTGESVAWFSARHGANAVGFAVLDGDEWVHLLHSEGPAMLAELPSRFGFPLLFPHVGHVLDARHTWRGQDYVLPPSYPGAPNFMHGFGHTRPWRAERTAPNAVRARMSTATDLNGIERAGYPWDVEAVVEIAIRDKALHVSLTAINIDATDAPCALGFHPYFPAEAFGVDRTALIVELPGRFERPLGPTPTGEIRPVSSTRFAPVPLGERALGSRARLSAGDRCTIGAPGTDRRIVLEMGGQVQDILAFCPDTSPSVSIEPLASAPSPFSRPDGHPDGPPVLPPGGSRHLTSVVRLER